MMSRPITWTISPPSGRVARSRPLPRGLPSRRRRRRRARCTASSRRYTRSGRRPRRIRRGPAGFRRGSRSPVHVAGDTPVLEPLLDPLAGLVPGVRGPLQPIEEAGEVLGERGDFELVGALAVLGGVAGDRRFGVLDLAGFEVALAPLVALVAAGVCTAVGAGPLDVPVREELVVDGVVRDHDLLLVEGRPLVEVTDELLGHRRVRLVVGVAVVVELDVELRERRGVLLVPVERELLGGPPPARR